MLPEVGDIMEPLGQAGFAFKSGIIDGPRFGANRTSARNSGACR
jgi:hypothetical protein